ncbi:MAG: hypothetical protein V4755_16760, partial [Curtobacterium sp.]
LRRGAGTAPGSVVQVPTVIAVGARAPHRRGAGTAPGSVVRVPTGVAGASTGEGRTAVSGDRPGS